MSTESMQSLRAFWFYLVQNIKPLFPCSSETLIPVCPLGFIKNHNQVGNVLQKLLREQMETRKLLKQHTFQAFPVVLTKSD